MTETHTTIDPHNVHHTPVQSDGTRFAKKYGWRPSIQDHRDHIYGVTVIPTGIPAFIDLRDQCPPVYNQKETNSCTAHAISAAFAFDYSKQKLGTINPSRLFIYYNERILEGTTASDAGASLRDGVSTVLTKGVPDETLWPFDTSKVYTAPPAAAYTAALKNKATAYLRLTQTVAQMQSALATGIPFVFGFSVYSDFESSAVASTGILPMPGSGSALLGGHAVMAVGYNSGTTAMNGCPPGYFIVRNSWGPAWGDKGYFYIPNAYMASTTLSSDYWVIKTVN